MPVGPIGPVAPLIPFVPLVPSAPAVPVGPVAPVAPVGPVGPVASAPVPSWPLASIKTGLPLLLSTPLMPAMKVAVWNPGCPMWIESVLGGSATKVSYVYIVVAVGKAAACIHAHANVITAR